MRFHYQKTALPGLLLFLILVSPGLSGARTFQGAVAGRVLINSHPAAGGVVYLVPRGEASPLPTPTVKTIVQKEMRFVPAFSVVTAGSTVRFENHDNRIHNIKSTSPGNRFSTGAHFPGKTQQIVFKHPGAVRLHCNIHFEMQGLVYVTPSDYYAVTDGQGRFLIAGLPEGDYRIEGWHPDLAADQTARGGQEIHVGKEVVRLDLEFSAPAGQAH